jgi:UDP-2-acetamido-2,6-beta-L-arabino-hexul-4-ose reductase
MINIPTFKLTRHTDQRGYLEEIFKAEMLPEGHREFGQCFLTTAKPGITKGNHSHRVKYELFYLVKGEAELGFLDMDTNEKFFIQLSDKEPQVVQIPPGPVHWITNKGEEEFFLLIYTDKKSMEADIDDKDTIPNY